MYTKSSPRNQFDASISEIKSMVTVRLWNGVPPASKPAFCAGVIILGFSALEDYINDIITLWLNRCENQQILSTSLPSTLRAFCHINNSSVNNHARYLLTRDERRFLSYIENDFTSNRHLFLRGEPLAPHSVDLPKLLQISYPSPDNLPKLFARIGINSIRNELNAQAKANIWQFVVSANAQRTACAHSYTLPPANRNDLLKYLDEISVVVKALDRIMFRHVLRHTSRTSWPT